jgi:hypothetical protein
VDIHDIHLTVKDVFTIGGQPTQALYTILSTDFAEVINNTHLKFNASLDDAFIWHHNNNGVYSAKSGYNWLISRTNTESYNNTS